MNWGDVPTWLGAFGTIGTGFILAFLACTQNQINQRSQKIDIALRYKDHFTRLSEAILGLLMSKTIEEIANAQIRVQRLYDEAELVFFEDVVMINKEILDLAKDLCAYKRYLNQEGATNDTIAYRAALKKHGELCNKLDNDIFEHMRIVYKVHTNILSEENKPCIVEILNKLKSYLKKLWVIGVLCGLGAGALFWCASLYFPYNVSMPSTQKSQLIDPLLDR